MAQVQWDSVLSDLTAGFLGGAATILIGVFAWVLIQVIKYGKDLAVAFTRLRAFDKRIGRLEKVQNGTVLEDDEE
jgi:hypothetical protein